jgi:hypothetical protein
MEQLKDLIVRVPFPTADSSSISHTWFVLVHRAETAVGVAPASTLRDIGMVVRTCVEQCLIGLGLYQ